MTLNEMDSGVNGRRQETTPTSLDDRQRASAADPLGNGQSKKPRSRKGSAKPSTDTQSAESNGDDLDGDDLDGLTLRITKKNLRRPAWYFRQYVSKNIPTAIVGHPHSGKSTFLDELVALAKHPLILTGEEGPEDELGRRLVAIGVKLGDVRFMVPSERLVLPRDVEKLIRLIEKDGHDFLKIDTIDDFVQDGFDELSNHQVRALLQAIRQINAEKPIPITYVRHPGKGEYNPFPGSRAFKAMAKAALELTLLPGERYKGVLRVLRPPHGVWTPDRAYELVGEENKPKRFVLGDEVPPTFALEATEVQSHMAQDRIADGAKFVASMVQPGGRITLGDIKASSGDLKLSDDEWRWAFKRLKMKKDWKKPDGKSVCYWQRPPYK